MLYKVLCKIQLEIQKIVNRGYEKRIRKKLKNDNFSILCSTCMGGIIYHRLGKQFLSPTINMWFRQKDFLKFIENLSEYLTEDLVFMETEYSYPVARLKDITLYFNHSKTEKEARVNWERRKKRINYDNLFIIMYDRGDVTESDIRRLENVNCKGKVVFSDKEYCDIEYVVTIVPNDRINGEAYLDKDWLGKRTFEKKWDFVKWLNCEE